MSAVTVHHLFISPGHNYFGHHGSESGTHPTLAQARVLCRAGRGLVGDRFFDYKPDYRGQITFFDWQVVLDARQHFARPGLTGGEFRRNVVIAGLHLESLIGQEFALGAVVFRGMAEARPCHWMEQAVGAGAEAWLASRGGLRAQIVSDGELALGPVDYSFVGGQTTWC